MQRQRFCRFREEECHLLNVRPHFRQPHSRSSGGPPTREPAGRTEGPRQREGPWPRCLQGSRHPRQTAAVRRLRGTAVVLCFEKATPTCSPEALRREACPVGPCTCPEPEPQGTAQVRLVGHSETGCPGAGRAAW